MSQPNWNQRNAEFKKINIHDGLVLNIHGFVKGVVQLNENDSITAELVLEKVENLVENYRSFMGISDTSTFDLETDLRALDFQLYDHVDSKDIYTYFETVKEFIAELEEGESFSFHHSFYFDQQNINNQKFGGSKLRLDFNEIDKTISISGNWVPEAFVPSLEIYNLDDAISIASSIFLDKTGKNVSDNKHSFDSSKLFVKRYR